MHEITMNAQEKLEAILDSWHTNGQILDVCDILHRGAELWPDTIAYICGNDEITYAALYKASQHIAHKLSQLGVHKSDRVIIYYANSIEFFIAYFAVWHIGAIVAPLSIFLSSEEFMRILHDAQPKACIISDELLTKILPEDLPTLPAVLTSQDLHHARNDQTVTQQERVTRNKDSVAAFLYTSGTTGFPKAVMLSSYNILYNTAQLLASITIDFQTRVFCPLPLFHCLPQNICVWASSLVGGTAITVAKIDRRSIVQAIEQQPNVIIAVPAIYGLFCMLKTLDFSSVKYFASGADALPEKIRAGFEQLYRRKIINGYGMTECSPFISAQLDDYTVPISYVGEPFPGIEVSIRNENQEEIPSHEIGTIWLRGANIMLGYHNAPEATDSILQDGWLNTGDLGRIIDGKIELCGRLRDLIVNKGLKIYPQEIEQLLLTHPQVIAAAAVGQKVDNEEIPVAFVAASNPSPTLEQELLELCKTKLAAYKIPRKIIIRSELPMNQTGKISKRKLAEELNG